MPEPDPNAATEFDFAFSSEIGARHEFIDSAAHRILQGSAAQLKEAVITAKPTLSRDRRTLSYHVAVENTSKLDLRQWAFQVGHFLYDVRATLDNIMWLVVHDRALGALTAKQEEHVYFPMAREEEHWRSFLGGPVAKVIRPALLERLEAVQPFKCPGHPAMTGLSMLSKIHLSDKHRDPITLELLPDSLLPEPLLSPVARHEAGELWVQLANMRRPITDGGLLKTYRYVGPFQGEPNTVPLTPVPTVVFDGENLDLQEFFRDARAVVLRVIDTVCLGNTFRSDLLDADIAWRREGVAALRRSLADDTNEWEQRGFNRPSPYGAVYDELRKDEPDFGKVFPLDL